MNYINTIDAGVKVISGFQQDNMITHFIYCGLLTNMISVIVPCPVNIRHFTRDRLEDIFQSKMRKYGIKSAILTTLNILREKLITKEKNETSI